MLAPRLPRYFREAVLGRPSNMETRRRKLIQELRQARESLLDLSFGTSPFNDIRTLLNQWVHTFRRCNSFDPTLFLVEVTINQSLNGYESETDIEVFNELRAQIVGFIDLALSHLDKQYEVKPVLEDYIRRVRDTKLAELLKEFNVSKDTSPNLTAIGFRTILALIIQEKAKKVKPGSNTATRTDLALDKMIDSARTDGILSNDEQRLLDSFKSTHKDIYDFVGHRPGANTMVGKDEVDTMVDMLNKLLPSIIN